MNNFNLFCPFLPQKMNISNNIFFQTLVSVNVTNKTSKFVQCPYYYAI